MAIYLRVEWHHEHEDEPIVLYSEIEDGLETRKVEVYAAVAWTMPMTRLKPVRPDCPK